MSDQQDEWWNNAASTPPAPPAPAGPAPAPSHPGPPEPTFTPGDAPSHHADPDATVVIPARHPGAPPADPGHSGTPAQYAPSGPPPGSPPPQYGGQPPQHGGPPPQYGTQTPGAHSGAGPQFVTPGGATRTFRAPLGSVIMISGALLAILGTFLPWITFGDDSVNGYETYFIGDGFDGVEWNNPGAFVAAAMVIVILSAILVLTAGRRVATWIIALLATGVAGILAVAALAAVASVLNNLFDGDDFGIGFGIAVCVLGAVVSGVGALVVAAKKS